MNRRRALLSFIACKQTEPSIPNNQILYTSSDGNVITPYRTTVFGANIISNTYNNVMGIITFDGDVTDIGQSAFSGCNKLTSVTIPNSVTTIGSSAFNNCYRLKSIPIPDSVTSIDESAFEYCDSLTSVTIGNSVTAIGYYAFNGCDSLKDIYCKPITPPTLWGSGVFEDNISDRKIYVPMESVEAYKIAEYWSEYADAIVGYNF